MAAATEAAIAKQVDLKLLMPNLKQCTLTIKDNATPMLHINDQSRVYNIELNTQDVSRLSNALNNGSLTDTQKQQCLSAVIGNIIVSVQMSQSYQQSILLQSEVGGGQ